MNPHQMEECKCPECTRGRAVIDALPDNMKTIDLINVFAFVLQIYGLSAEDFLMMVPPITNTLQRSEEAATVRRQLN